MEQRDRFMLENMMNQCWHITDDLHTIASYVAGQGDIPPKHQDEIMNMLFGMKSLYNQRFSDMMDLFGEMIQNGHIEGKNVY
jgi:hypothetical protein